MAKESAVKERVLRLLRARGAFVEKMHGNEFMRVGLPDILGCYQGLFLGIELKRSATEQPDPAQLRVLAEIWRAGGYAAVVYDPDRLAFHLDAGFPDRCCRACLSSEHIEGCEDELLRVRFASLGEA